MSDRIFKVLVSGEHGYRSCRPCLPKGYVVEYCPGHASHAIPGTKLFCFNSEYHARCWGRQGSWPGQQISLWHVNATGITPTRGRSLPNLDDPEVIDEWWRRTLALPSKTIWQMERQDPDYARIGRVWQEYDRWLNEHSGFPHNVPQDYPPGTVWADTITLLHNLTERLAA